MYMQISKPFLTLLATLSLTACGGNDAETLKEAEKSADEAAALDGKVECALAGSDSFERTCTTERIAGADGQILVIRHADGGFRRFKILTDGRGLAPADGFDETKIALIENAMIEVSSGDDKYRLPAQIKPQGSKPKGAPTKDGG